MAKRSHQTEPALLREADGKLCLAFVNTVAWRKTPTPEERLASPAALADWCAGTSLFDAGAAQALKRQWRRDPEVAVACHRRAVELREAIYSLCRSQILGKPPADADLSVFNNLLAAAPSRQSLAVTAGKFGWQLPSRHSELDLLAPVIWSAADLLTGPPVRRVRQCEDPKGCGWLFLGESRAGTRRWGSMGECGNRAKARRHYLRVKRKDAGS